MLHPSYTEVLERINSEEYRGEEPAVNSRYSIVMATAKRAREIINGAEPLVRTREGEKPLSIAIAELNQGKVKIVGEEED